jgi:hypothetical protein
VYFCPIGSFTFNHFGFPTGKVFSKTVSIYQFSKHKDKECSLFVDSFICLFKGRKMEDLGAEYSVFLRNSCPAFRCIRADCFVPHNDSAGCHYNQG